jgi:hypothetical protein
MSMRLRGYLAFVLGAGLSGALVASPAWAAGLEETRRGFGIGRSLVLLCCLVVVGLVVVGVLIGLMISRSRRNRP